MSFLQFIHSLKDLRFNDEQPDLKENGLLIDSGAMMGMKDCFVLHICFDHASFVFHPWTINLSQRPKWGSNGRLPDKLLKGLVQWRVQWYVAWKPQAYTIKQAYSAFKKYQNNCPLIFICRWIEILTFLYMPL